MSVRPLPQPATSQAIFTPAGELLPAATAAADGTRHFQGTVQGGLGYGPWELVLSQDWYPFGASTQTATARTNFFVDAQPSSGCFAFDGGRDQGWTRQGVLHENGDAWDPADSQSNTSSGVAVWENFVNFPLLTPTEPSNFTALEGAGALAPWSSGHSRGALYQQVTARFPIPASGTKRWRVDFLSPDLTTNTDWAGTTSFNFRIAAAVGGFRFLPRLKIKRPSPGGPDTPSTLEDGSYTDLGSVDGGGQWTKGSGTFNVPAGATVTGLVISVYANTDWQTGIQNKLSSFYVDLVCRGN